MDPVELIERAYETARADLIDKGADPSGLAAKCPPVMRAILLAADYMILHRVAELEQSIKRAAIRKTPDARKL